MTPGDLIYWSGAIALCAGLILIFIWLTWSMISEIWERR